MKKNREPTTGIMYVTLNEVAELLRTTRETLHRWRKTNKLL